MIPVNLFVTFPRKNELKSVDRSLSSTTRTDEKYSTERRQSQGLWNKTPVVSKHLLI